jgi:glycosyltransferase involved in cell wall biosynthesis
MGLPVVVSARGAPPERIGSAGVAVAADDVAALRGAVERLLADPRQLCALADAPRPTRTMADVARELTALYREAAASA